MAPTISNLIRILRKHVIAALSLYRTLWIVKFLAVGRSERAWDNTAGIKYHCDRKYTLSSAPFYNKGDRSKNLT